MAIKSVQLRLNDQIYDLAYDSVNQVYQGNFSAPTATSFGKNGDNCYHAEVIATDTANNVVTATVEEFSGLALRVLEKGKPVIAVSYPTANAHVSTNQPTIKWAASDDGSGVNPKTAKIKIDDGELVAEGISKVEDTTEVNFEYVPPVALSEGAHTLTFTVEDNDGNISEEVSVVFAIDTIPPILNVTSPADDLITNNPELTVSGTTNDVTSAPVTVEINGQSVNVDGAGVFSTVVSLVEGENIVVIVATDSAGKSTTVTREVLLDTVPPVITSVSLSPNPVDAGQTYIIRVAVEKEE